MIRIKSVPLFLLIISIASLHAAWAGNHTIETNDIMDKWDFLNEAADELICFQDTNYAMSLHAGTTKPYGDLNKIANDGHTVNLDIVFPLSSKTSWDLRFGYSDFMGAGGNSDVEILDLSINLAYALRLKKPWIFLNGGLGVYYIDNSDAEAGFNIGAGIGYPLGSNMALEITYNYHAIVTGDSDFGFGKLQVGILKRF